jgi:hypothetical protein
MEITLKSCNESNYSNILVLAVLGRKNDDVYGNRIARAIHLIKDNLSKFDKIHLLAKSYSNSKWKDEYINEKIKEINPDKKIIFHKTNEKTLFYRYGLYSFDTIEEAAMIRLCIENLFENLLINLCIVTSEFHSIRADKIFDSLYNSFNELNIFKSKVIPNSLIENKFIYVNPSPISETEKNENLEEVEKGKLNKLIKKSSKFKNFWEFYQRREIIFEGKRSDEGKKALIQLTNQKLDVKIKNCKKKLIK